MPPSDTPIKQGVKDRWVGSKTRVKRGEMAPIIDIVTLNLVTLY